MGVVASIESAPAECWPRILDRLATAGIRIDEVGEEAGLLWCSCRRRRSRIGLALETGKASANVTSYCGVLTYYRRPWSTRELLGEVLAVVLRSASEGA